MTAPKPVELTEAELDAIVEWQLDMDEKYNLPFTTNAPRIQDGVKLHHAGDFTSDVINLVSGLVAAREAAARREALEEAATKCDCAALLIETNSHEEHCAIYRDPERERDEAVAALRRVEALEEKHRYEVFRAWDEGHSAGLRDLQQQLQYAKGLGIWPEPPRDTRNPYRDALAEPECDEESGR